MMAGAGNPTIDNIEAVASVFKIEAWELLIDEDEARRRILAKLLHTKGVSDEDMENHGFHKIRKTTK